MLVLWENPVWQLNWSALELVVPNHTSDTIEFQAPAQPVPAEPVPAEPVPTEPVPTEPVPTEPVTTEQVETAPKVASEAPAKEMEQMGQMESPRSKAVGFG